MSISASGRTSPYSTGKKLEAEVSTALYKRKMTDTDLYRTLHATTKSKQSYNSHVQKVCIKARISAAAVKTVTDRF